MGAPILKPKELRGCCSVANNPNLPRADWMVIDGYRGLGGIVMDWIMNNQLFQLQLDSKTSRPALTPFVTITGTSLGASLGA